MRGTWVNIRSRSSTGRREIGDAGVGAGEGRGGPECDGGAAAAAAAAAAVGGECGDEGRCSIDGWEGVLAIVRRRENRRRRRNGGQGERPSGGSLRPTQSWINTIVRSGFSVQEGDSHRRKVYEVR